MEYKSEQELRVSQLKFIGKVLSVFTHELNNHLAVIKESVGLMEDTLRFQKSTAKYDVEESLKIIQSIESQIGKTSWLCKQLSSFGHRMDKPLSTFSVNESIEELVVLLNRIANQKKISFEKDFQENIPVIHNDPSMLQFLIFCLIEEGLRRLDKNGRIIFKTTRSGGSIAINIIQKGNFIETDEKGLCSNEISQHVINQLGGTIYQEEGGVGMTITLPISGHSGSEMAD